MAHAPTGRKNSGRKCTRYLHEIKDQKALTMKSMKNMKGGLLGVADVVGADVRVDRGFG